MLNATLEAALSAAGHVAAYPATSGDAAVVAAFSALNQAARVMPRGGERDALWHTSAALWDTRGDTARAIGRAAQRASEAVAAALVAVA